MHSVIAYGLSILSLPFVGFAGFLLTLPMAMLAAAGKAAERISCCLAQAITNALMVLASHAIFGWLDQPFSATPIIVIGILVTLFNLARVARAANAWSVQQSRNTPFKKAGFINDSRASDRVADEWAYTLGGIAGVLSTGWWLLAA